MRFGMWEIILVLVVALLFFGPSRLPQLGASLGKAIRDLKKGLAGGDDDEPAKKLPPPAA